MSSRAERVVPLESGVEIAHEVANRGRLATIFIFLVTDLAVLVVGALAAVWARQLLGVSVELALYYQLLPLLAVFPVIYAGMGLYPGFGRGPVDELRRLTLGTSLAYLVLASTSFLFKSGFEFSRGVFLLAWVFSLIGVPLGRAAIRWQLARRRWWGEPVLVLGAGKTGRLLADALRLNPGLGLRPVALLDDDPEKRGTYEGIPVLGRLEVAATHVDRLGVSHAMVAMPGIGRARLVQILHQYLRRYPRVTVIPELFGVPSVWVVSRDFDGVLGLEIRNQLLHPSAQRIKRILDVTLSGLSLLLLSPVFALIAVAIKLDSPGPVLYGDNRIGRKGQRLTAWKFRTMVVNAEQELARILRDDPVAARQYEIYHKLPNDPRITRVGRWLRRWSLDELPQLWNVFRGEMSLVGPRAYLAREAPDMKEAANLILEVAPGITGLWQVSGRSHVTFADRLRLDQYYVQNWSIWLDLYLLARTIPAVLLGEGAY